MVVKMCTKCGLNPKQDVPYARLCKECVVSCKDHQVQKYNCNPCRMAKQDSVRHTDRFKEIQSRSHRRRKYGLDDQQLDDLLAIEGCQVCGSDDKLVIDHDHVTGAVRGMLCHACNKAEGLLAGDVARIRALADYLEREPYASRL